MFLLLQEWGQLVVRLDAFSGAAGHETLGVPLLDALRTTSAAFRTHRDFFYKGARGRFSGWLWQPRENALITRSIVRVAAPFLSLCLYCSLPPSLPCSGTRNISGSVNQKPCAGKSAPAPFHIQRPTAHYRQHRQP